MSKVAGYFVVLDSERLDSFECRNDNRFAEPVPEFSHARYVPLICFIIAKHGKITHIGIGKKKGFHAGTDLRSNTRNFSI